MDHDDVLTMLKTAQNPVIEAVRRIDDQTCGELRRIACEAQQSQWSVPTLTDLHFPLLPSAEIGAQVVSRALMAGGRPREWMERVVGVESIASYRALRVPSATEQMLGQTFLQAGSALTEAAARLGDLVGADRVIRDMKERFGEPLSGYTRYIAGLDAQLATSQLGLFGPDAFGAIERDFEQLRCAAIALDPLQNLTDALTASLGNSLALEELQAHLNRHHETGMAGDWAREYQSFAALIADMWGEEFQDGDVDENIDEDVSEVAESDTPAGDNREIGKSVWPVAIRYGLPAYELKVRLTRLAGRIDPTVHGGTVSWEHMILAIGYAHPTHAVALIRLAYPFFQQLSWATAPRGPRINGATESLALDEVEAFESLTHAVLDVLKEIEEQTLRD